MRKILFWVNCYGGWDPDRRNPLETIGYNHYLNQVVEALVVLKDQLGAIHVSGGMYDDKGQTEIETTIPELKRRLRLQGIQTEIHGDDESVTSISIVKKCLSTLKHYYPDDAPILVSDTFRAEINRYTVQEVAAQLGLVVEPRKVVLAFDRQDDHPHSTIEQQAKKLARMKKIGADAMEREDMAERQAHIKKKK